MHNNPLDIESFKKYFSGKMNPEERTAFLEKVENDPFAKEAMEGFSMLGNEPNKLNTMHQLQTVFAQKAHLEPETNQNVLKYALAIAASFIILLSGFIGVQWYNNFQKQPIAKQETTSIQEEQNAVTPIEEDVNAQSVITIDEDTLSAKLNETFIKAQNKEDNKMLPQQKSNLYAADVKQPKVSTNTAPLDVQIATLKEESAQENELAKPSTNAVQDNIASNTKVITETQVNYKSGIVAFNQGNFNQALTFFEEAVKNNENVGSSNYYLGMSYYNLNQSGKAIPYYDKVINSSSNYADDAKYYKALSLVGKGQNAKAKTLLQELANSNSSYNYQAIKKLETIK